MDLDALVFFSFYFFLLSLGVGMPNLLIPGSFYFTMQQNTLKADLLYDHQAQRI